MNKKYIVLATFYFAGFLKKCRGAGIVLSIESPKDILSGRAFISGEILVVEIDNPPQNMDPVTLEQIVDAAVQGNMKPPPPVVQDTIYTYSLKADPDILTDLQGLVSTVTAYDGPSGAVTSKQTLSDEEISILKQYFDSKGNFALTQG